MANRLRDPHDVLRDAYLAGRGVHFTAAEIEYLIFRDDAIEMAVFGCDEYGSFDEQIESGRLKFTGKGKQLAQERARKDSDVK